MKILFLTLMMIVSATSARAAAADDGCDSWLNQYSLRNGFDRPFEGCVIREPALGGGHRLVLSLFHSETIPGSDQKRSEWMIQDDTGTIDADFIFGRNAAPGSKWDSKLSCTPSSLHVVNRSRDGQEWVGDIRIGAGSTKISLRSSQHPFAVEAECK